MKLTRRSLFKRAAATAATGSVVAGGKETTFSDRPRGIKDPNIRADMKAVSQAIGAELIPEIGYGRFGGDHWWDENSPAKRSYPIGIIRVSPSRWHWWQSNWKDAKLLKSFLSINGEPIMVRPAPALTFPGHIIVEEATPIQIDLLPGGYTPRNWSINIDLYKE